MALIHAETFDDSDEGFHHDNGVMGLDAHLFVEHPTDVLQMFSGVDWEIHDRVNFNVTARPQVRELLDSCANVHGKDGEMPLKTVLALYAIQQYIPGVCQLPSIYFELTRNSIKTWMVRETHERNRFGTCSITGVSGVPTVYVRKDDAVIEVAASVMRNNRAWKEEAKIESVAVKQIGMSILSKCPVCVLRRSHRPTNEDPNVPAFPFTEEYLQDKNDVLNMGNPVDTGSLVLTAAYLKLFIDKYGKVQKQIRRQCTACMAVAIKDPAGYYAYICETQVNRGRGPVTPEMVAGWRKETLDAANIRHMTKQEAIAAARNQETRERVALHEKEHGPSTQKLLAMAAKLEAESPGFLKGTVEFTTSEKTGRVNGRLCKGVKASALYEILNALGAIEEESS